MSGPAGGGIPFARINAAAAAIGPSLVKSWLPGGRQHRDEYVVRNPARNDHKAGSFSINLRTGQFYDFASGDKGGDFIALYAFLFNVGQGVAARELAALLGLDTSAPFVARPTPVVAPLPEGALSPEERDREKKVQKARAIWHAKPGPRYFGAHPAEGSAVETYLRGRGITIPIPPTIRHTRLPHAEGVRGELWDVMLARMQDGDVFTGVHRTFLTPGGRKAPFTSAKMMLGRAWGSTVRLGPLGPNLVLCEGIETALSVLQLAPAWTVWAALSAGNLSRVSIPLPGQGGVVRQLAIVADADLKFDRETRARRRVGLAAAYQACEALMGTGIDTTIVELPANMDANDVLTSDPELAAQLAGLLEGLRRVEPVLEAA